MNTYYKSDLKKSYLILEGKETQQEDYEVTMLRENRIPSILETDIRIVDNCMYYHYNISGCTSLQALHEKAKLSYEEIKQVVDGIVKAIQSLQSYMLDANALLLDPEYIFCRNGEVLFCYYPENRQSITTTFHELTEYFVREADYKDEEGVHLAYTLHKETMERYYSIEAILQQFTKEEPEQIVSYQERIEQKIEENMIEDRIDMWEPIRRLLERKKRNHANYFGEDL